MRFFPKSEIYPPLKLDRNTQDIKTKYWHTTITNKKGIQIFENHLSSTWYSEMCILTCIEVILIVHAQRRVGSVNLNAYDYVQGEGEGDYS